MTGLIKGLSGGSGAGSNQRHAESGAIVVDPR